MSPTCLYGGNINNLVGDIKLAGAYGDGFLPYLSLMEANKTQGILTQDSILHSSEVVLKLGMDYLSHLASGGDTA